MNDAVPTPVSLDSVAGAAVTDAAPALISYVDCDLRYRFVNKRYEAWFGRRREEVVGKPMREVLGELAMHRIQPYVDRALNGEEVHYELEAPYATGGSRWIDAQYVPDRGADGRIQGFYALVVDVSARKRANAALAKAARQQDALYQLSERLQRAQTREDIYEAAFGAISTGLECDRASILLFDDGGYMRFAAWRGLSDGYRAAVEGHSPWTADAVEPTPIQIPDVASSDLSSSLKSVIDAEGIAGLAFIPLVSDGRLIGKFMAYFDRARTLGEDEVDLSMTIARQLAFAIARERADEALRASEQRFRQMIDALPAVIYTTDAEGRVTHFNPAAVEFSGRTPTLGDDRWCVTWKLFHPDGSPMEHADCPMAVALNENRPVRGAEAIAERPNGERRWFMPYPTPLRDPEGRVVGGINMLVDITERKRAEEGLKEADRRKDEFLAMLAHELRNPLAPITNAVHLLQRSGSQDPLQQQARAIIDRQAGRLTRLVDDLLEVSRITTGRIQLHMERVELSGIVERAVDSARTLIEQHRHAVSLELPAEPVWLYADAARLEQVLVNLLNNAAKYTEDGGRIDVQVATDGAYVVVRVIDTGIGIEPELLPRIFDLFTQAERSLDRSQGGLGIGLSLVKRLVAMHGGSVQATSVLGEGSKFCVRLPTAPAAIHAHAAPRADAKSAPSTALRVLVVDDNADAAQSLALLLETSGHRVSVAHTSASALEAARTQKPEVVFLDIGLPELDGYEVARRLRRAASDIMLIAMTGYGQASDRERSRKAGFDHHLVKPADYAKVEEILAKAASTTSRAQAS